MSVPYCFNFVHLSLCVCIYSCEPVPYCLQVCVCAFALLFVRTLVSLYVSVVCALLCACAWVCGFCAFFFLFGCIFVRLRVLLHACALLLVFLFVQLFLCVCIYSCVHVPYCLLLFYVRVRLTVCTKYRGPLCQGAVTLCNASCNFSCNVVATTLRNKLHETLSSVKYPGTANVVATQVALVLNLILLSEIAFAT